MKNNLIAISGRIGSGKDLTGQILQILSYFKTQNIDYSSELVSDYLQDKNLELNQSPYQIKKYADKLKDIVCMLIGCTREQLEDREFKEKELGEEWWVWKSYDNSSIFMYSNQNMNIKYWELIKTTPRLLLQLLGTDCGRQIIHPNIWVNSLFADYKVKIDSLPGVDFGTQLFHNNIYKDEFGKEYLAKYPNWIITDCRFPNEVKAVQSRGGVVIRINRPTWEYIEEPKQHVWINKTLDEKIVSTGTYEQALAYFKSQVKEHESETALDDYQDFDYVIENDGSIEELIEKIKNLNLV